MAAIPRPPEQQIIDRIYAGYAAAEADKNAARGGLYLGRLGASSIGEECIRKVWLSWRAYAESSFEGRMLRLFETGHLQENRIVADLKRAGLQVFEKREDGKQFEFTDPTGHLIVKMDGVVKGVPESADKPYVLEIKTHNKNSFSAVQRHGVEKSKPLHVIQMQVGMWLGGLTRALYVALCKDDEQYYIERVAADRKTHTNYETKVIKLVEARMRPAGISDDGEGFGCKFCDMKEVCTGRVTPLRNCRTCQNCAPAAQGTWECTLQGKTLNPEEQRAACAEYEVL
jgi:hypothetical protein